MEETEGWVSFRTSMGLAKMPRARIESIERESEEVNKELLNQWKRDKSRPPEVKPEPEESEEEKPEVRRTYSVEIRKRRIALGGTSSGVSQAQPIASFTIEDLGMVEGIRLFHVQATSYMSSMRTIKARDFYVLSTNEMRVDPEALEGYPDLDVRLGTNQAGKGHVGFPTNAPLKTMIVRSELADFELDLETGDFATKHGFF